MPKLLFSLLIFILILGIPSCKINETPADLDKSIPGVEIPKADSLLQGGEILKGILGPTVFTLAIDKDNVLWMSISNGITAYYDNKFQIFDPHNTNISVSFYNITQILVDSQNKKWFGNRLGDVFTFDNQNWKVLPTPDNVENIVGIKQDNEGTIWVLGEQGDKGMSVLWSYKDGRIDKFYSNELGSKKATCLAIDSNDNMWVGTDGAGLYKINGDKCDNLQNIFTNPFINNIYYDKRSNVLYISAASGYTYINDNRIYCEGGIYIYKDERFEALATEKTGLPSSRINTMLVDGKGNLWLGYPKQGIVLGKFDGGHWVSLSQESPFKNCQIRAITSDDNGHIWILGRGDLSSEQSCLATFNGETWAITNLPVLPKDPRTWWREKDLAELFKYPASSVNMEEVSNDPLSHHGKKVAFIGKIESGFEYASMVDKEGTNLYILPDYQDELPQLLKDTGIDQEIDKSEHQEYVGYLELIGYLVHLDRWQFALFITEVYPYVSSEKQKTSYRKLYESYLNVAAQDKQDIKSVIDQWISARRSGNIEELKEIYPPDSGFYEYLLTEKGQEDIKNNTIDVTINDSSIKVENINATVRIYDATVKPERYSEPYSGGIGIYKLRYIKLQKYGTQWKIIEIFYAPDPAPMPAPIPQPTSQ
jgi:ligand-binding sensor domain-containing protein